MRSGLLGRMVVLMMAGMAATPVSAAVEHSTLAGGIEGIYLTGAIEADDAEAFAALAARYSNAVVYLESPGGDVAPALEIGRLARQHGYATAVLDDGTCTSACALIWLAGMPRYLGASGHLGFHASYAERDGRRVEVGVGNALIGRYLAQLDLSEKAVIFATSASPYTMTWLNSANSGDAEIGFEPAPASLPSPPETFLALSGPLQKAQADPSRVAAAPTPVEEPGKQAPRPVRAEEVLAKKSAKN